MRVPGGIEVNYSSWASHRLPDVWEAPDEFRPERFAPGGERDRLPKHAYVPFGGGSRTCIGMRFGQAEIRIIASSILARFRLDLVPGLPPAGPPDAHHRSPRRDADDRARGAAARPARRRPAGAVGLDHQRPARTCSAGRPPPRVTGMCCHVPQWGVRR